MAIDPNDYTHRVRQHLRKVGACAVIVTAANSVGPFTLATTTDPQRRLAGSGMSLVHILWTPGKPVAARIERAVRERLKVFACEEGDAYATDLLTIRVRLDEAARGLYPGTPCLHHGQMLAVLQAAGFFRQRTVPEAGKAANMRG